MASTPENTMKKTFKLNIEGKNRDRLLDAVRHDIHKDVKRQRRAPLPEGLYYWDFDCRIGASEASAEIIDFASVIQRVDAIAAEGVDAFYLEMLPVARERSARPASVADAGDIGQPGEQAG